jgi:hypothetical protein
MQKSPSFTPPNPIKMSEKHVRTEKGITHRTHGAATVFASVSNRRYEFLANVALLAHFVVIFVTYGRSRWHVGMQGGPRCCSTTYLEVCSSSRVFASLWNWLLQHVLRQEKQSYKCFSQLQSYSKPNGIRFRPPTRFQQTKERRAVHHQVKALTEEHTWPASENPSSTPFCLKQIDSWVSIFRFVS